MKVLVATQKPFSAAAVKGIKDILTGAGHQVEVLENYAQQADFVAAVADAEAIIIRSDKVTAEVIAAAPKLKIVVRAGAGYDNVDLEAASAAKVVVMNTPGQNANAVAELAIGMMIYMARTQFNPGIRQRRPPGWQEGSSPWNEGEGHRSFPPRREDS